MRKKEKKNNRKKSSPRMQQYYKNSGKLKEETVPNYIMSIIRPFLSQHT